MSKPADITYEQQVATAFNKQSVLFDRSTQPIQLFNTKEKE